MKRMCTSLVLGGLLALGTANMATAQQPTTPAPGAQPTAPTTQAPSATPSTPTPGTAPGAAGSGFVPLVPGSFLTTVPVNAQFHRFYGGLNLAPPTAVALPVGAARPAPGTVWTSAGGYNSNGAGVLPNGGLTFFGATQAASDTTTPGTIAPVYNSTGPGVLPNGGVGVLAPYTLATPAAGSAFFPASPGTAMTTASVNPQFNRLFSGLSAGVQASSVPAQSSPGTATPGYNGPGVVPNGSTPGGSGG